ncbi:MAG: ATP-grasp domain-containing protein [Gemmatimonadetes bacterium]|nr:ATP-grasp domain-containing protein [Gemmatimonadota bacterium]
MIRALAEDLGDLGHEVIVPASCGTGFARLLEGFDATWIIAPESEGCLERLTRAAASHGTTVLGSSADAIAAAASKDTTVRRLERARVPVVPTLPLTIPRMPPQAESWPWPRVLKPDDGAGCVGTAIAASPDQVPAAFAAARRHSTAVVAQPYLEGEHASVAVAAGPRGCFPLAIGRQRVSAGEATAGRPDRPAKFRYLGGTVPLESPWAASALRIAREACAAIPGLLGFAGVDLVLTPQGPVVIEINPRLTTAYLGLRRAAVENVAGVVLATLEGAEPPPLRWRGRATFTAAGSVRLSTGMRMACAPVRAPAQRA